MNAYYIVRFVTVAIFSRSKPPGGILKGCISGAVGLPRMLTKSIQDMTMTQIFSMTRPFFFTCLMALALALPHAASAQENKNIPAVSQEEAAEASAEANKTQEPGDQAVAAPDESVSDEEAISASDAIGAYEADKVKGHAVPWQMHYQKAASPVMEHLTKLHDAILVIITIITIVVLALLVYICIRFRAKRNPTPKRFAHNTLIEIIWTIIPILILIGIGIPSVRAHFQYTNNENIINNPDLTLKVTGNQWYWHYEYPEEGISFDSNIVKDEDLKPGEPRLRMVDHPVVVPVNKVVRVQLTSVDVIHNWAMPAFGVKQDTVPGKLSETWFKATETGIFFGQCSELCGKFHGFMPIMVKVVSEEEYKIWVRGAKRKFADAGTFQFASLN